jgi:hypothetical protein
VRPGPALPAWCLQGFHTRHAVARLSPGAFNRGRGRPRYSPPVTLICSASLVAYISEYRFGWWDEPPPFRAGVHSPRVGTGFTAQPGSAGILADVVIQLQPSERTGKLRMVRVPVRSATQLTEAVGRSPGGNGSFKDDFFALDSGSFIQPSYLRWLTASGSNSAVECQLILPLLNFQ